MQLKLIQGGQSRGFTSLGRHSFGIPRRENVTVSVVYLRLSISITLPVGCAAGVTVGNSKREISDPSSNSTAFTLAPIKEKNSMNSSHNPQFSCVDAATSLREGTF